MPRHFMSASEIFSGDKSDQLLSEGVYLLSFDLETTGLSVGKDSVCEIGLEVAEFHLRDGGEGQQLVERVAGSSAAFQVYCRPRIPMEAGAMAVTGLSNQFLEKQVDLASAVEQMQRFVDSTCTRPIRRVLVSYNGFKFDVPLLVNDMLQQNVSPRLLFRCLKLDASVDVVNLVKASVDTTTLRRADKGRCSYKLTDVYLSVIHKPLQGAHGALADCQATLELLTSPAVVPGGVSSCSAPFVCELFGPVLAGAKPPPGCVRDVNSWVAQIESERTKTLNHAAGLQLGTSIQQLLGKRRASSAPAATTPEEFPAKKKQQTASASPLGGR